MKRKIKLRYYIALTVILLSLILTSSIGGLSFFRSNQLVKEEVLDRLVNEAVIEGKELEHAMDAREQLAKSAEALLLNTFDSTQWNLNYFEKYKASHKALFKDLLKQTDFLDLWIFFNPEYFPEGTHTITHRKVNGEYELSADGFEIDMADKEAMKWWYDAIKHGEYWTSPYYWEPWDMELLSYTKAIYQNGKLLAIIGSDFDFTGFRKGFESKSLYKEDYMIVFDSSFKLIIHPDHAGEQVNDVLDKETFNHMLTHFSHQKKGVVFYEHEGEKKILAFYQLNNKWVVGLAPNFNEVYQSTILIRNFSVALIILGILLSIFYASIVSRRMSRPIKDLVGAWKKGSEGNLQLLRPAYRTQEFNTLAQQYNQMASKQNQLVKELNQASDNLREINKELDLVMGIRGIHHNKFGFISTPKLSAMYKQGKLTYRASFARGFKTPTLKELYYYYESERMGMYRLYLGNEDLKPQKSNYISFSLEFKKNKFSTSMNVYHNEIFDMIEYKIIPTSPENKNREIEETKQRYNINRARTRGLDWIFHASLFSGFSFGGGYSYVDARNLSLDIRLNGVAEHSATCKFNYSKKWKTYKLKLNLSGQYKSDKFYLEEDQERSYAKPYQLWKLTSTHQVKKSKKWNTSLVAGIDNIFDYVDDSPYGGHYGTLNPGRTLFLAIQIVFSN